MGGAAHRRGMAARDRPRVKDTDKTKNLEIELCGELTLDEMESVVAATALRVSRMRTTPASPPGRATVEERTVLSYCS